jgi:pentatricopeptide repeat protein
LGRFSAHAFHLACFVLAANDLASVRSNGIQTSQSSTAACNDLEAITMLLREQQQPDTAPLDDSAAAALGYKIASSMNTEMALDALQCVRYSRRALASAAAAFAAKGSVRGVSGVEKLAESLRLLSRSASSDLWFALIRAYGRVQRLKDVLRCFKRARERRAWTPANSRLTSIYLNALHTDISLQFTRARQLRDAGAAVEVAFFNTLLKGCMRAPDPQRARLVAQWMNECDLEPDAVSYSSMIKAHSYGGDFEGVLAVRETMRERNFQPPPAVWGDLLVACGAAQHPETALMIWREAKAALGGPASTPVEVYDAMLTACNATRQRERSLSVLEEMKAAGVKPRTRTYNLALRACEGAPGQRLRPGQLECALALYDEMLVARVHPDAFTFASLMELCAASRQGGLAQKLYADMQDRQVQANVVIMTSLLKALARAGMVAECQAVFRRMVWGPARMKPNICTYRTLARELREAGALAAALQAYEGMRKARFAPSNREFQELISAAAEAALSRGDAELQAAVASLCNITSLETVDLHGMSTVEARAAVLCTLSMLLTEYQGSGRPPAPLVIITGRGEHSLDKPVMPATIRALLEEELRIVPMDGGHTGAGEDRGHEVQVKNKNPGRIVVGTEQLLRWLRARGGYAAMASSQQGEPDAS